MRWLEVEAHGTSVTRIDTTTWIEQLSLRPAILVGHVVVAKNPVTIS